MLADRVLWVACDLAQANHNAYAFAEDSVRDRRRWGGGRGLQPGESAEEFSLGIVVGETVELLQRC
jgi:hypothetical protein